MLLGWLRCWWRGYHLSPGEYGWQFLQGGFEVWCATCGRSVGFRRKDDIKPGPETKYWEECK
jgi:hypothetical protein